MQRFLLPLSFSSLVLIAVPAWAQQSQRAPREGVAMPPPRAQSSEDPSLSESVRWAQRSSGGRVLGAERVQSEGRQITRIKVIDDAGRVRYMDDNRRARQPEERVAPPPSPRRPGNDPSRP